MAALDFDGDAPRLDGVRADIVELAAEFPGAHFSLIRFDSQARLELPWTTDLGALETAVSVLRQERALYSRGSRLDLPLQVIDEQLARPSAGERSRRQLQRGLLLLRRRGPSRHGRRGADASTDKPGRCFLTMTTNEQPISSFAELAPDVDGGAVFGYGTTEGAPMLAVRRHRRAVDDRRLGGARLALRPRLRHRAAGDLPPRRGKPRGDRRRPRRPVPPPQRTAAGSVRSDRRSPTPPRR